MNRYKVLPKHISEMPIISRKLYGDIYVRRYKELNWFGTTIGMPGTGKTTTLLKMFYELQVDPKTLERNFVPEKQVVFTVKDFLTRVRETDPKNNPGYCILYDEIEIDANSRGWGAISKQLELAVSTMRFKKNILGASLPHERQLLKSVRRLRNARIDCKYVNHYYKYTYAKWYNLDYNMTADTYRNEGQEAKHYFPRYDLPTEHGTRPYRICGFKVQSPPHDIIKRYKRMKVDFLEDYYAQQISYWEKEEAKQNPNTVSFSHACGYIDRYKDELVFKGRVDPVLLAEQLKITTSRAKEFARAYNHKKEVKKIKRMRFVD